MSIYNADHVIERLDRIEALLARHAAGISDEVQRAVAKVKLPEPDTTHYHTHPGSSVKYWSDDQIVAYAHQCVRAALEAAALQPASLAQAHSPKLKAGLESAVRSIQSRPPELRGSFKSTKPASLAREGDDGATDAERVLSLLPTSGTFHTATIAQPEGMPRKDFFNTLSYLVRRGDLEHLGYSKYRRVPALSKQADGGEPVAGWVLVPEALTTDGVDQDGLLAAADSLLVQPDFADSIVRAYLAKSGGPKNAMAPEEAAEAVWTTLIDALSPASPRAEGTGHWSDPKTFEEDPVSPSPSAFNTGVEEAAKAVDAAAMPNLARAIRSLKRPDTETK